MPLNMLYFIRKGGQDVKYTSTTKKLTKRDVKSVSQTVVAIEGGTLQPSVVSLFL